MYNRTGLCDDDCNRCPIVVHSNSRMLTHVLSRLYEELGNKVYEIVQKACPNFTVCYDCRQDDFCHDEDCDLVLEREIFPERPVNDCRHINRWHGRCMHCGERVD